MWAVESSSAYGIQAEIHAHLVQGLKNILTALLIKEKN